MLNVDFQITEFCILDIIIPNQKFHFEIFIFLFG